MPELPTPVQASVKVQPVTLKKFASPYWEAVCGNCTWGSYMYGSKDEAETCAEEHSERCCNRLNQELAEQVEVTPTLAQDIERGAQVLLKDLRVMDIEAIEVFDDEVMVIYSISGLESQIMVLPVGRVVKVVA